MDGFGVYGYYLHYSLIIFFVGSAFLVFIFLWKKNRLDMDEQPKFDMLLEEENTHDNR